MRCAYCDTPESWTHQKSGEFEWPPFSKQMETFRNPISLDALEECLRRHLQTEKYHSVSITGGEPLLHSEFLAEFLPKLRSTGTKIYLETSGTLAERLREIIGFCDIVAFDIKLTDCEGVRMSVPDVIACIKVALHSNKEFFCKVVVTGNSSVSEWDKLLRSIVSETGTFQLVFTPVSLVNKNCVQADGKKLHEFVNTAESLGFKPIIVPQIHRLTGWL